MSILVNICVILLGITLVFGGVFAWWIRRVLLSKQGKKVCAAVYSKKRAEFHLERGERYGDL